MHVLLDCFFRAGKSEAEIEKFYRALQTGEAFRKTSNAVGFDVPGRVTVFTRFLCGQFIILCFVSIFQMLEGLLADDMLHPAGVLFRRFTVNTGSDELLCKELMAFIDFFSPFPGLCRSGGRNPSSSIVRKPPSRRTLTA